MIKIISTDNQTQSHLIFEVARVTLSSKTLYIRWNRT